LNVYEPLADGRAVVALGLAELEPDPAIADWLEPPVGCALVVLPARVVGLHPARAATIPPAATTMPMPPALDTRLFLRNAGGTASPCAWCLEVIIRLPFPHVTAC
jgi:hypothetical protein